MYGLSEFFINLWFSAAWLLCTQVFSLFSSGLGFTELLGSVIWSFLPDLEKFCHYFFKSFSAALSLFCTSITPVTCVLDHLMLSVRSWRLFFFSLCSLARVIPIDLSSSILTSIGYNLFKNPFSIIFISDIVLFSSGISIWFFAKIPHLFTQKDNWRTLFYSSLSSFIPFASVGHP